MLRSLWLPSWYPSNASPQNGDFIQRHAYAASEFAKVDVIYVVPYTTNKTGLQHSNNLTEKIIYYNKRNNSLINRTVSFIRYFLLYKKSIKKYIEENGKPDIVHVHVTLFAGILALWIKRKYNISYVLSEHGTIFTPERKDNFTTRNFLFKYYSRKVIQNASLFLPVSNSLGTNVKQMTGLNIPFVKIPNVVKDVFSYSNNHEPTKPFRFVHVSSLNNLKNATGIISAFSELIKTKPNSFLKIVGKNYFELKSYAEKLNIPKDKIIFTGEIPYEQVAEEMIHSDAFVLFSNSETFCCVLAESLCAGKPVIATNLSCIQEIVNGQNSILVHPENEAELTEAMKKMINNYSAYNQQKISQEAKAQFNYHYVGKKILDIYNSVLKK